MLWSMGGIQGTRASELWLQALEHRFHSCGTAFGCSVACGIFSDQGQNLCLLHWHVGSPLNCQGCSPGLLYAGLFYRYFPSGIFLL